MSAVSLACVRVACCNVPGTGASASHGGRGGTSLAFADNFSGSSGSRELLINRRLTGGVSARAPRSQPSIQTSAQLTQERPAVSEREAKQGPAPSPGEGSAGVKPGPKVLIAGGGIGGLVLALACKKKGMDVTVFERDLTAIRGEGQYRGPIQIQSNALAALEAVDQEVAEEIMANGCVTGDRINGLVDGLTGEWYCKFDTYTPAVERGLPVTRVVSRMKLQEILARAVGPEIIRNGATVTGFEDNGQRVRVQLSNGEQVEGDILVGADGIWSKVRTQLLGKDEATYSDYTCYTGIAEFTPPDIETVGYRVFLGHKQYFVSSDVGQGRMQWYAFYNEPAGGKDEAGKRKERLMELFGHWCDGVTDLILATPEDVVLRRDIYDRRPIFTWGKGRVTLLGDSAHAMQPNMGQGGCMAIEDSFQLALDLSKAADASDPGSVNWATVLKRYEGERRLRVGAIHGLARMAAIMASTYKAYLGEGLGPLEKWLTSLRIPHPGKVGGRFVIKYTMPPMLSWVLGGNQFALEGRAPHCRLEDRAQDDLQKWMNDNDALEQATLAQWYLVPCGEGLASGIAASHALHAHPNSIAICCNEGECSVIGSAACDEDEGVPCIVDVPQVSAKHAKIVRNDGIFQLSDLGSQAGTWITRIDGARFKVAPGSQVRLRGGDTLEFGPDSDAKFRVKLRKAHQPTALGEAVAAGMA